MNRTDTTVKFGVSLPNFGEYADPHVLADLAVLSEQAGWDGFFVWDHIVVADGTAVGDPWVQLAAVAERTTRLSIGPMVTPLPRRRPWVVARQATSLDHLSGGRLILGVGLGSPPQEEFATFGEPTSTSHRAGMLDEALEVLDGMWSGEPFSYEGNHYVVTETAFGPEPVQRGGIPIWVAATWPATGPLQRAGRFAGIFPMKPDMTPWTLDEVRELVATMSSFREGSLDDFDVVIGGGFDPSQELWSSLERVGVDWYVAGPGFRDTPDTVAAALERGPR